MNDNCDELTRAIEQWFDSVLELLAAQPSLVERFDGFENWSANKDGSVERMPFSLHYSPDLDRYAFRLNEQWGTVRRLALSDKNVCELVSYLEKRLFGRDPLEEMFKSLLPWLGYDQNRVILCWIFPRPDLIRKFLSLVRSSHTENNLVWPIRGINTIEPIILEDNLQFRSLHVHEKLRVLRMGVIAPFFLTRLPQDSTDWFGLHLTEERERILTDEEDLIDTSSASNSEERENIIEDFLAAASFVAGRGVVHAGGSMGAPSIQYFAPFDSQTGSMFSASAAHFSLINTDPELSSTERVKVVEVWKLLRRKAPSKLEAALAKSIRRIYFASTRPRPEDQLIDLMIAAESVFGGDGTSEKTFRLSIHVSLLVEEEARNRESTFKSFKDAYGIRSKIVHGQSVNASAIRKHIETIEEKLKVGIYKLLESPELGSSWPDLYKRWF